MTGGGGVFSGKKKKKKKMPRTQHRGVFGVDENEKESTERKVYVPFDVG
jgi:hypothetical protein